MANPITTTTGRTTPVAVQNLDITVDIFVTVADTPVPAAVGGDAVPTTVDFRASTEHTGLYVIRAYPNSRARASYIGAKSGITTFNNNVYAGSILSHGHANSYEHIPGLYLESAQLDNPALLVLPYSVIQQKIAQGGTIRVYTGSKTAHTGFATGAVLYKNGVLSAATSVAANDGAVWAVYEPPAAVTPI
jgi:hypothetical protein